MDKGEVYSGCHITGNDRFRLRKSLMFDKEAIPKDAIFYPGFMCQGNNSE